MRWEAIALAGILLAASLAPAATAGDEARTPDRPQDLLGPLTEARHAEVFGQLAGDHADETPQPRDAADALVQLGEPELDRARARTILKDVPSTLQQDVATLLIALARADHLVDAERDRLDLTKQEVLDLRSGASGWTGASTHPDRQVDPAPTLPAPRVTGADPAPFLRAQSLLIDAVDTVLQAPPTTTHTVEGCPVHETPYLIVCGTDARTYAPGEDAILVIDLGGDDVYENAQGTPFGTIPDLPADLAYPQLILDLVGDDTYERTDQAAIGPARVVAQGAAVLGIGAIVDLTGDDRYIARAHHAPISGSVDAHVIAQGAAHLGVGLLVDPSGRDCVDAEARSHGALAEATAQGASIQGAGLAVLTGDHAAEACPTGPRAAAIADPIVSPFDIKVGPTALVAQGAADGGAGLLHGGPFDDDYRAIARGGLASLTAQGASTTGAGLLHDAGGADRYHALGHANGTVEVSASVDASAVRVFAWASLGSAKTITQGATLGGLALHADEGLAANQLLARATIFANATAKAHTTDPDGTTWATATTDVGRAEANAHGFSKDGHALSTTTTVLEALAGDGDDRAAQARLSAHANATATGGVSNLAEATTRTADAASRGQGFTRSGTATLLDAVGDDRYALTAQHDATANATVSPNGTALETLDAGTAHARGHTDARQGLAALVDLHGEDTYIKTPGSSPAREDACWSDSPPSGDTDIGIGIDALTTPAVPDGCLPPPN